VANCCTGNTRSGILWNSTQVDEWSLEAMDKLELFFKDIKNKIKDYQPDPDQIEKGVEFFLERFLERFPLPRYLKEVIPYVAPSPPRELAYPRDQNSKKRKIVKS
jgi:hypothetical protein